MEDTYQLITIIAGILGIVTAILALIFGPKSLTDLFKESRGKKAAKLKPVNEFRSIAEISHSAQNTEFNRPSPQDDVIVESFKDLVKKGDYKGALEKAELERRKIHPELFSADLYTQMALDDFDVWHARALIYTGEMADGESGLTKLDKIIKRLEENEDVTKDDQLYTWRRYAILGRAHNDKGYAHWMDLGHHEIAVQEFSAAIQSYARVNMSETDEIENLIATTYDNLGRVYSQLGDRLRADLLIEYGRKIRSIPGREDRYALSLNSSAIAYLAFGEQYHALELSKEALRWFQKCGSKRGEGLAKITMGQAQRHMGELWLYKKVGDDRTPYKNYLRDSLKTLNEARKIFTEDISEPIRECQIYNEIGCVYRELVKLEGDLESAEEAKRHIREGMKIAEKNEYWVMYVDGCEDFAQFYVTINDAKSAHKYLAEAEGIIKKTSNAYFFQKNKKVQSVAPSSCVEDYWQHLGKIYALKGHILFDDENRKRRLTNKDFKNAVKDPLDNYALAAGYFGRFLEIAGRKGRESIYHVGIRSILMNHRIFGEQIYSRLREVNLNAGDVEEINNLLNVIKNQYDLKDVWVDSFLGEVLDLLKQTKP